MTDAGRTLRACLLNCAGSNTLTRRPPLPWLLLVVVLAGLVWSGIGPHDRLTWVLEVLPVLVAVPLLLLTAKRFPLTPVAYVLVAVHSLVLVYGGHYTYSLTPLGDWMRETFDFSRNHYDRIGHLMQGFGPAIIARELLLRTSPLRPGKWLFSIVCLSILGVSACYEFTEWWAALAGGDAAGAFLGTQGDVWDTQWDMFLAGCGAVAAQLSLGRMHDAQLARIDTAFRAKLHAPKTAVVPAG
jgi:putative membrane protein